MKTILHVFISLLIVATTTQALSASPNDSVTGPPPIAIDVYVINDESSPVSVVGDVNANVSGAVDVNSVPTSLTDQLDTLIEEVRKLASPAQELTYGSDYIVGIGRGGSSEPIFVPDGVVLTDIVFNSHLNSDDNSCYVFVDREIDPMTGAAELFLSMNVPGRDDSDIRQLHSGILSDGNIRLKIVHFGSSSPTAPSCRGTLVWHGYRQ